MALVEILNERFDCHFILQKTDEKVKNRVSEVCKNIIEIPLTKDFLEEASRIGKLVSPKNIIVLDGYHFTSEYQYILKKYTKNVVLIDDLHISRVFADIVINPSPGISKKKYNSEAYTKFYL